ncbi:MAG: 3-phosphoshikimate 1-carboxyvinyltransferase [Acidimicrobiales bacterium]|nr:3-phosphoshikimate 1-carboxyvinyltransferase [Acidimicrobiales bacterium]
MEPLSAPPQATVTVPGSKSFTNRALVVAALADGESLLEGALFADDTEAMLDCLRRLGFTVEADAGSAAIRVQGKGGLVPPGPAELGVRLSGTTARFVAPLAALGLGAYRLDGLPPMRSRPMGPVIDALRRLGAVVHDDETPGHLPFTIEAGGLHGGPLELPGDQSSQFLSGLLLCAPAMRQGLRVELTTPLVSRPYVDITVATMAAFGVEVVVDAHHSFSVAPQRYRARSYGIEPDASAASYFFAAAAITGGRIRVEGLGRGAVQGDVRVVDVLEAMGATVVRERDAIEVVGPAVLQGVDVDLADLSDTAQTIAAVAVFASTPTRVTGIGFIRRKETDRIAAVVRELRRCGIEADEEPDGFLVRPGRPRAARIETYDDHRMAMSFSLLGLVVPGIEILDPGCVAKTFPDFFERLDGLRTLPRHR